MNNPAKAAVYMYKTAARPKKTRPSEYGLTKGQISIERWALERLKPAIPVENEHKTGSAIKTKPVSWSGYSHVFLIGKGRRYNCNEGHSKDNQGQSYSQGIWSI